MYPKHHDVMEQCHACVGVLLVWAPYSILDLDLDNVLESERHVNPCNMPHGPIGVFGFAKFNMFQQREIVNRRWQGRTRGWKIDSSRS